MENKDKIINDLKVLGVEKVLRDEPLYKHTTYKVGGPGQVFVVAKTYFDIGTVIDYALKNNIKYFVLGAGSNVLFNDSAFKGIIVSTRLLNAYEISGNEVYAECGMSIIALSMLTAQEGLSGLEFASGIPGFIGGAIYMNAGAYKKDISSILKEVLVYRDGKMEWLKADTLDLSYRHSIFQEHRDWIIIAARFGLHPSQPEVIKELIQVRKVKRMETQPYDANSAGSVFKNPENHNSWELIDRAGLRGFRVNDAQVSLKHPNFIVNADRASAKDIYALIRKVQKDVEDKFGVHLKVEVELVNFDE